MNKEEALDFLKKHQPMPSDDCVTQEELDNYKECIEFFENNPDVECIPLFLNSFSEGRAFEGYDHVRFVLYKLPPENVVYYLKQCLYSENRNIRYWCANFALDYSFPELVEPLTYCLKGQDKGIRKSAVIALQFIPDKRVSGILQEAYEHETYNAVKKDIEEALKYRKDNFGY